MRKAASISSFLKLALAALCLFSWISASSSATWRFKFNVEWKSVTRLCHTKQLLTVNGQYPGPTIAVHEGDHVEIKVTNSISSNTTLHWHGIKQLRTALLIFPKFPTSINYRKTDGKLMEKAEFPSTFLQRSR
ncbi:unnamed protein product [Rhodiola kirilowii]